jgi:hypothetical protein
MRWALLISLIFLLGCKSETIELPIPEEELLPILIDVHLAEAALQNLRGDTKDSMANLYYEQICTIHQVNRKMLDSSITFLRSEPIILEKLYTKAMEEADKMSVKNKVESKE